jgi:hypothetical protein
MGLIADTPDLYTFTCDSCDATYTGKPHELAKLGWKRHQFTRRVAPKRGEVLLCDVCEAHYQPIWKAREERKAA